MGAAHASAEQLAALASLAGVSHERLAELAELALVERSPRGSDPLRTAEPGRALFLLHGELLLSYEDGGTLVVVGGSGEGCHALNRGPRPVVRSKAITDVDLVALDDELFDMLAMWEHAVKSNARFAGGAAFALKSLKQGALAQLPAAHVEELVKRFEPLAVARGEAVIREGDGGEDYYLVAAGRLQVERMVGGAKVVLAELKSGDAFGEEALVSEAKRNASVVALSDAQILRVRRSDFDELLREPLLRRLSFREAVQKIAGGGLWLDVRAIRRNISTTSSPARSTCRSRKCAICLLCSIARATTSPIARAAGAAPLRRSFSRSAAFVSGCSKAV